MMNQDDILFSKIDWYQVEAHQRKLLEEEIEDWDENQLLNASVDDFCKYLVKKYRIDAPVLDRDNIALDRRETQVDVSRDRFRAIEDRSKPVYIPGTEIEITVPFTGEADVFKIRLPAYALNPSPPRGKVEDGTITFSTGSGFIESRKRRVEAKCLRDTRAVLEKVT